MDLQSYPPLIKFAVLCIFFNILIIVIYFAAIIYYIAKAASKVAPLNIEALDYAVLFNMTFIPGSKFNYTYIFMIFYGLSSVLLAYYFKKQGYRISAYTKFLDSSAAPNQELEIQNTVSVLLLCSVIALIAQIFLSTTTSATINGVKRRTNMINTYIRKNLYKNSEFLAVIRQPATTILETNDRIIECLKILGKEKKKRELAQGFFTLTFYNYYQNFSLKNNNILPAFKTFNLQNLLTSNYDPISYMPRYGTFIEDITESIIRPNMKKSDNLNEALYTCDSWISKTNEYANTIYPEASFDSFIILLIGTAVVMTLFVAVLVKYYKSIN